MKFIIILTFTILSLVVHASNDNYKTPPENTHEFDTGILQEDTEQTANTAEIPIESPQEADSLLRVIKGLLDDGFLNSKPNYEIKKKEDLTQKDNPGPEKQRTESDARPINRSKKPNNDGCILL